MVFQLDDLRAARWRLCAIGEDASAPRKIDYLRTLLTDQRAATECEIGPASKAAQPKRARPKER